MIIRSRQPPPVSTTGISTTTTTAHLQGYPHFQQVPPPLPPHLLASSVSSTASISNASLSATGSPAAREARYYSFLFFFYSTNNYLQADNELTICFQHNCHLFLILTTHFNNDRHNPARQQQPQVFFYLVLFSNSTNQLFLNNSSLTKAYRLETYCSVGSISATAPSNFDATLSPNVISLLFVSNLLTLVNCACHTRL